jgi:hypothetical protein
LNITLKRRIASLEQRWPRRQTFADFHEKATSIANITGTTYESVLESLLRDLSTEALKCLAEDAEKAAFGDDPAARDAAREKALAEVAEGQVFPR